MTVGWPTQIGKFLAFGKLQMVYSIDLDLDFLTLIQYRFKATVVSDFIKMIQGFKKVALKLHNKNSFPGLSAWVVVLQEVWRAKQASPSQLGESRSVASWLVG